ncbi:MAG TPA: hypothetical protein VIL41_07730 [Coriobacteriia bacterium]
MSEALRHRFVFVYPYEPGAHEARVHGFEHLRSRGFEVEALVVPVLPGSPVMQPSMYERDGLRVTVVPDEASLAAFLVEMADTSIFVDFLFGLEAATHRGRDVLPAIVSAGGAYCVVSGGALPPASDQASLSQLRRRLALIANPVRLRDFVGRKVGALFGTTAASPPPVRVFSGHSEALEGYLERTGLTRAVVTSVNSFDYDAYLAYMLTRGGEPPAAEPIAVFLDEDASGHPDFALLGDSSGNMEAGEYAASLRRLFDAVEQRTGLRVIVAAHPRADYAMRSGFFGDREVVNGSTVDLVARSSMVIAHASTAVSFAALADKPLLVVKTAAMLSSSYTLTVDRVAGGLSIAPICSDEPGVLDGLDWDYKAWSRAGYATYLERYVRSHDAPADKTTWEIVAETLQDGRYVAPSAR